MTEWRPVVRFEDFYEVSDEGEVRSKDRYVKCNRGDKTRPWKGKQLSKILAAKGYYQVSLSAKGEISKVYIHRLVAEAFYSERNETVNHKDGDKTNNRKENLEWVTYSENNSHAFRIGLRTQ